MDINKTYVAYFSPTFATRDVVRKMGEIVNRKYHEFDLTDYDNRNTAHDFERNELLIIGAPTFSGRIPNVAKERINKLRGHNTPCIVAVTYGNRDYDNALLELKDMMENLGFKVVGATAIITQHSIVKSIATDRPNTGDLDSIKVFVEMVMDKLERVNSVIAEDLYVPGNPEYINKENHNQPLKYHLNRKRCDECGVCIKMCPVQAIEPGRPIKIDSSKCFGCMRCIKVCPKRAREYNRTKYSVLKLYLRNNCEKGRKNEFYL